MESVVNRQMTGNAKVNNGVSELRIRNNGVVAKTIRDGVVGMVVVAGRRRRFNTTLHLGGRIADVTNNASLSSALLLPLLTSTAAVDQGVQAAYRDYGQRRL
jgi:hypothetical protein